MTTILTQGFAGIAMALLLTKDRETETPVGLVAGLNLVATARGR